MAPTKKQTIEFTAKTVKVFTAWLKRFSTIDKSLLLEIDQSLSMFIAKTYNEERSVVKMSSVKFDEAGLIAKSVSNSKRIRVGIYNISQIIKIMDQFSDSEFTLTIEYQEVTGDNDVQYAGEKILFKNKQLKMNVDCTSLNIFKYITDDLFRNQIAQIDTIVSCELTKPTIDKINTLNGLDSDNKFMQFKLSDDKILVSGKTYELAIVENSIKENFSISIFKDQYSTIDIENYDISLGEDRMVFNSKDSDTITVISKAEDSE